MNWEVFTKLKLHLLLMMHGVVEEDDGSQTAEYALVALAAAAFAGTLIAIFRGGEFKEMLYGIIERALSA